MNCESCKAPVQPVPYIVHESAMSREERKIKRIVIGWLITVLLWFCTMCIGVYAWLQYDYTSDSTVTVDASDGVANYIGNDGDIVNGADSR